MLYLYENLISYTCAKKFFFFGKVLCFKRVSNMALLFFILAKLKKLIVMLTSNVTESLHVKQRFFSMFYDFFTILN